LYSDKHQEAKTLQTLKNASSNVNFHQSPSSPADAAKKRQEVSRKTLKEKQKESVNVDKLMKNINIILMENTLSKPSNLWELNEVKNLTEFFASSLKQIDDMFLQ